MHVSWMPQIPFAFEFEREWSNDLCVAKLPFDCSEILHLFCWKLLNGNLVRHFKIKNIYIFECEWLNGNLNDLCTAELPFGHSHWNLNANGNWGIQNAQKCLSATDLKSSLSTKQKWKHAFCQHKPLKGTSQHRSHYSHMGRGAMEGLRWY